MHFYLLNQYFPPDVAPTGHVLRDLAAQLVRNGFPVTVFCSRSKEEILEDSSRSPNGIEVRAVWTFRCGRRFLIQRLLNFGSFYVALFFQLLIAKPAPGVIVALTTPPYLGFLARVVARIRGSRSVDWIMDVYPDVMEAHGMLSQRSLAFRFLKKINSFYLGRSDLVISLGPDMAARLAAYHQDRAPNFWIPLWADRKDERSSSEIECYRKKRGWTSDQTVFLYSGNIGLGHRFAEFLTIVSERGIEGGSATWGFFGQGGRRSEVESFAKRHPDLPFQLGDYVSESLLAVHLAAGDVHLASMDPSWDGCMVPSKFQGSYAAGRPVLFVGSKHNSLAEWLYESGGGWVVPPGDTKALHEAVIEALDVDERRRRGQLALAFAKERFDRETNCQQMVERMAGAWSGEHGAGSGVGMKAET